MPDIGGLLADHGARGNGSLPPWVPLRHSPSGGTIGGVSLEQILGLNAALTELSDLYVRVRRFALLRAGAELAFLPALTTLGRRLRTLARSGQLGDETVAEAAREILALSAQWSSELQRVRETPEYRRARAASASDDQRTLAAVIPLVFAGLQLLPSPPVLYAPFSPSSGHRKPGTSPFLTPLACAEKILGLLQDGLEPESEPGAWWQQDLPAFTCVDDPAGVDTPIALSFDPAASGRAVFEHAEEQTCVVFARRLAGPFSVALSNEADDEWWTAYDGSYSEFRDMLERELQERGCRVRRVATASRA
jgi:hypothetical protein